MLREIVQILGWFFIALGLFMLLTALAMPNKKRAEDEQH